MSKTLSGPNIECSGGHESYEPPEIIIAGKVLYHGSATSDIVAFERAENVTLGNGVYFVDNHYDAAGYARRRARNKDNVAPVVYKVGIERARLVNLDNPEKLSGIMLGFAAKLEERRGREAALPWYVGNSILQALTEIDKGVKPGQVRLATYNHPELFTVYLQELGYDGLKSQEGGEGMDVGPHETFVIFDPRKTNILESYVIAQNT